MGSKKTEDERSKKDHKHKIHVHGHLDLFQSDKAAWENTLATTRPEIKGIAVALLMTSAFLLPIWQAQFVLVVFVVAIALTFAGVQASHYLSFLFIVLLFVIPATLPIALELHIGSRPLITLAEDGINQALLVAGRTFACSSALLMYGYSTPMVDTIDLLRRLKVPDTIIELMVLMYRTMFTFLQFTQSVIDAQHLRGGHSGPILSLKSASHAIASSLSRAFRKVQVTAQAMELRGGVEPTLPLPRVYTPMDTKMKLLLGASVLAIGCSGALVLFLKTQGA